MRPAICRRPHPSGVDLACAAVLPAAVAAARRRIGALALAVSICLAAAAARAQDGITGLESIGKPSAAGTGFQPAATELARDQQWLDGMLLVIISVVTVLVVGLLAICILRFNSRRNPMSARFSHNTPIEITWTLVPLLILVGIGAFSFPILVKQQVMPPAELTIKATGRQWFWSYEYPEEQIAFDALMLRREDLAAYGYADDEYLLATDNAMVVPVDTTVVMQITASDVIHAWTIPAFAVKQDAIPGRIGQLWFRAEREGIYFGQCSELCGSSHAYMPITVKVVDAQTYAAWLAEAQEVYSIADAREGGGALREAAATPAAEAAMASAAGSLPDDSAAAGITTDVGAKGAPAENPAGVTGAGLAIAAVE